jgi:hypothetical protein
MAFFVIVKQVQIADTQIEMFRRIQPDFCTSRSSSTMKLLRIAKRFASGGPPGNARWTTYTTSPYEQKVMNGFMDEVKKGFVRDGGDYLRDIGPAVVFGVGLVWWADGYFHHQALHQRF